MKKINRRQMLKGIGALGTALAAPLAVVQAKPIPKPTKEKSVIEQHLLDVEWTMGNGQCHECCGGKPGEWFPHPCYDSPDQEGHEPGCMHALMMVEAGLTPVYRKIPK